MRVDFVGRRNTWFAVSAVVIAIGVAALIIKGLTFGIEFKGGTLFEARFKKNVSVAKVRSVVRPLGLGDSVIQKAGNKSIHLRTAELTIAKQQKVKSALSDIGAKDFNIQGVGASWGERLTTGTLVALLVSLVVVFGFVAVRFEFKMGTVAVMALFHDIIVAVGLYALVGREVTTATVAAFLTILGYSLYDTIVIFDRVRENTPGLKLKTYSAMVNDSVNQSLRRSINTSLTSIIPVVSLLVLGGETLNDFAFALLVGLVSGAYSSLFIASPVLAIWKETEPKYVGLRKRLQKAERSK